MSHSNLFYKPLSVGCIRMPLYSYQRLHNIIDNKSHWDDAIKSNQFRSGLYHASAELHRASGVDTANNPKLEKTLYKYLSRSATRCTPFGKFAGVGTFILDSQTSLKRPDVLPMRSSVALEVSFLERIAQQLLSPRILPYLTLRVNPTLFIDGNTIRYEYRTPSGVASCYSVTCTPILRFLLKSLNKEHQFNRLYLRLSDNYDLSIDKFADYIIRNIKAGIIITPLLPEILSTGNYLSTLLKIAKQSDNKEIIWQLRQCQEFENSLNNLPDTESIALIEDFKNQEWVKSFTTGDTPIVQVDSYINEPQSYTVSQDITSQILEFLILNQSLSTNNGISYALSRFRSRYEARYENSPQLLVKALDEEVGIGYGDITHLQGYSMLSGVGGHTKNASRNGVSLSLSYVQKTLLDVLTTSYEDLQAIALENHFKLSKDYDPKNMQLGRSFNAMFQVIGNSCDEYQIYGLRFCGSSALNLLGRFAEGSSKVNHLCEQIARSETMTLRSDEIIGELCYIPYAKAINVLHRKAWDCISIEYLSLDSNSKKSIPISDLWVHITPLGIRLYSKSLKKYIVPRIASAHNIHNRTGLLYRFLGDLQSQHNQLSNVFVWGNIESLFNHLPRLTYKHIIVQPEKWNITLSNGNRRLDASSLRKVLQSLNCPRELIYREGDNCLWIDYHNDIALNALIDAARRHSTIWLEEFIAPASNIGINECILPFIKASV